MRREKVAARSVWRQTAAVCRQTVDYFLRNVRFPNPTGQHIDEKSICLASGFSEYLHQIPQHLAWQAFSAANV